MIWNSWFNEGKSFGCFDPCWRSLPCFHPCWRSLVLNVFLGPSADPNTTKTMQMFWTFFGRSCEPFLDLRKSAVKFAHARDFCGSRGQTNALATIAVCCGTQCFITDSWFRWVFPAASIPNDLAMPGRSFEKNPLPETKIATEHSWFEDDRFPFGVTHFQGRTISFREDTSGRCVFYNYTYKLTKPDCSPHVQFCCALSRWIETSTKKQNHAWWWCIMIEKAQQNIWL